MSVALGFYNIFIEVAFYAEKAPGAAACPGALDLLFGVGRAF